MSLFFAPNWANFFGPKLPIAIVVYFRRRIHENEKTLRKNQEIIEAVAREAELERDEKMKENSKLLTSSLTKQLELKREIGFHSINYSNQHFEWKNLISDLFKRKNDVLKSGGWRRKDEVCDQPFV